jgi:hypothetical protein
MNKINKNFMNWILGEHKLNSISKTVAYTTHLLPQLDIVNLQNYIHDAEYPNEHNIRYAEIHRAM